jgi:hypothetical protein
MKAGTHILLSILFGILCLHLNAQGVLWQETFDDDPFGPDPFENWTSFTQPSENQYEWKWTANGKAEGGTYWNDRQAVGSPSGGGAIAFDSDSLISAFPPLHIAVVTSPLIFVLQNGPVYLSFYQYFRSFHSGATVEIVDVESGEAVEIHHNNHIGANIETSHKERVVIDLTDFLQPGFPFQLRFTFIGEYYFWIIDDITLYDAYPYPTTFPAYIGDSLASFGKPYDVNCEDEPIFKNQLVVQFNPGVTEPERQELRDSFGVTSFESCMCELLELWNLGNPLPPNPGGPSSSGMSTGIDELKATASASSKVNGVDQNRYTWNELQTPIDTVQGPLITPPAGGPGQDAIIVAILDTGIDYEHPDLENFIVKEIIEDQFDCITGDTIGWNFVDKNDNPMDNHSHGTHLAGIVINNIVNETSCAEIGLLAIKTHDEYGVSDLFDVACGMYYALQHGAKVINCSWGWVGDSSKIIGNAIDSALLNYNALVIAAAGNDAFNLDEDRQYPACDTRTNVLSVGSVNSGGTQFSGFSNFSSAFVDIAAPGENILSARPGGGYWEKTGTSMAAPAVAAAAASVYCLAGREPTPEEVVNCILESAVQNPGLGSFVNNGRVLSLSLDNCAIVPVFEPSHIQELFLLAPNPASSTAFLTSMQTLTHRLEISVFDLFGRVIWKEYRDGLHEDEKIPVTLENRPPGVYVVRVSYQNQRWSGRLVKY